MLWEWDGTLEHPPHALCRHARTRGRTASPTAAIIDSQSDRAAPKGSALDVQGYDAGKKVTGRKRHILVHTLGLPITVVVHRADVQDRDGARLVLDRRTRRFFPFLERAFAAAGYQGAALAADLAETGGWVQEIVKHREPHRFVVLPKRWNVERALAWISRNRRLARDFERYARTVAAFIRLAMLRRLTRSSLCS